MDHVTEIQLRYARERFAQGIRDRAKRLRAVADELDRLADRALTVDTPGFTGSSSSNTLAYFGGQVVHTVIEVLPNLNLASLVDAANDYELARREAQ